LRRPADFAAVLAAPRSRSLRAARHWLSMTAAWFPGETPAVRFGVTVGRRMVRRAVDRALVKRILREAAWLASPGLAAQSTRRYGRLDVAFRVKVVRGGPGDQPPLSLTAWRRALRAEADALLQRLDRHLTELAA
jgi:ribonuclease P protein component